MLNKKFFKIVFFVIIIITLFIGCIEEQTVVKDIKYKSTEIAHLKEKQGKLSFNIVIRINDSAEKVRLWVPYPVSNKNQKIENVTITGNYNSNGIYRDGVYGNMILYTEWNKPKEFPNLNFSFDVWRTEVVLKNFPDYEGEIPIEMQEFLQPTNLAPNTGIVKEVADKVTIGKKTILSKAIAIYDYVVEHGQRDPNLNFCGNGDVCVLLLNLRGKCVDFSSVFVALSRASGVPAREILGTRISKDGDITGAYHCIAEFYLPNYGWVPVDPSDVAKFMLNENLNINDSRVIEVRDYFFGSQTETYIDFSTGRDVVLNPIQNESALNYFMYPYAEIDGVSLDFISQEYLRYSVTFKEKLTS